MHALKILSVENAAEVPVSELSGGMKKRVSIARALVMEPQLLLYDEPTSELDPVMSATISEIIATLKNEYSVTSIVVTHDRSLALTISNRVGILMAGKLITLGTPGPQEVQGPADRRFPQPEDRHEHPRFKKLETTRKPNMNTAQQTARVGLFFLLGVALVWVTFETLSDGKLFEERSHTLIASFDDLKQLKAGDEVRLAGVKIGSVKKTRLAGRRAEAVLRSTRRSRSRATPRPRSSWRA
jgi:ABC-type multidrug transport system ATPase subunit